MRSYCLLLIAACLTVPVLPVHAACEGPLTTACIADEIRDGLDATASDPFAAARINANLARAELADGNEEAALAAHEAVDQEGWRQDFALPHARFLQEAGRQAEALKVLGASAAAQAEGFDLLDHAGLIPQYAQAFAAAGDQTAASALLDKLAEELNQVRPNPMTLALMEQLAEAADEIGDADQAKNLSRNAYAWFDVGALSLGPAEAVLLFRTLAQFDPSDQPPKDAAETIAIFAEEGASVYDGAIWTGVALGLHARGVDPAPVVISAIEALDAAPEREAAARIEADLAPALAATGRVAEARTRLLAAAETAISTDAQTYAGIVVPVAAALIDIGAHEEARQILDRLVQDVRADAGNLALFAQPALVQYVRLGAADEALALGGNQTGSHGLFVANALIGTRDFDRAYAILRDLDDDARFLLLVAISEHLAYGSDEKPSELDQPSS